MVVVVPVLGPLPPPQAAHVRRNARAMIAKATFHLRCCARCPRSTNVRQKKQARATMPAARLKPLAAGGLITCAVVAWPQPGTGLGDMIQGCELAPMVTSLKMQLGPGPLELQPAAGSSAASV